LEKAARYALPPIAIGLWLAALCFPAMKVCLSTGRSSWWENEIIAGLGFMGVLTGHFGWFANPPLLGWVICTLAGWKGSAWLALPIFGLGCLGLVPGFIWDDAGTIGHVCGHGPGFWLWYAATAIPLVNLVIIGFVKVSPRWHLKFQSH
jgi:hypothetical protein